MPNTGSAATVIFKQSLKPQLANDKTYRGQAGVNAGSFGRLDQNVEAAVGMKQNIYV